MQYFHQNVPRKYQEPASGLLFQHQFGGLAGDMMAGNQAFLAIRYEISQSDYCVEVSVLS